MVPANKIIETAIKENVDLIGLSGLITPSLDEMCFVASELERNKVNKPLLIGGATTSKIHTAIKIDPLYGVGVCHVNDASKAVSVATNMISKNKCRPFVDSLKKEYLALRENYYKKDKVNENNLKNCRENRMKIDWKKYNPVKPKLNSLEIIKGESIKKILEYTDWKPFFEAWELYGKFPDILDDDKVGNAARDLWRDSKKMIKNIINDNLTETSAVLGFWPANSDGDDVIIFEDDSRKKILKKFHFLRQQVNRKNSKRPNLCLSDYIAPIGTKNDYIGGFLVTAGGGIEKLASKFESENDDYNSILVKSIGDRIAEAYAEMLHKEVRTKYWGYDSSENLTIQELISEKFKGIRPAPGYPACPDHTEKQTLFELLKVSDNVNVKLTESFAMTPASSVSGFYISNPLSSYFGVGKIFKDQVEDYAVRKGLKINVVEKWLGPNLSYSPKGTV